MALKALSQVGFLLVVIFFFVFLPSTTRAHPLRIWAMHNGPSNEDQQITPAQIKAFTEDLRIHYRIILENGDHDLGQASGLDEKFPLASYIIDNNPTLDELKRFQQDNPGAPQISIEFLRWANAFNRFSAVNTLSLKEKPDVVQMGSTWTPSFAKEGILENVEGRFDGNIFFAPAIASARPYGMDGLFAIPWFVDTRIMFYWKDSIPNGSLASWDVFKKNCASLIENNPSKKSILAIPLNVTWNILHILTPILWSYGGDILEANYTASFPTHKILLDNPNSIKAIEGLRNLSADGCIGFEDSNVETLEREFLKGRFAAIITGPWFLPRIQNELKGKIAIALPPEGPHGSYPFVGGSQLAILKDSKERGNLENAVNLINFLTSDESQKRYSENTGFLPSNKKALSGRLKMPAMKIFYDALENGRSYPAIPEWGSIVENEFIQQNLWHVWHGIAEAKPMSILGGMIKSSANELRKKVAHTFWNKGKFPILFSFGSFLALGGVLLVRSRKKYQTLISRLVFIQNKLSEVDGERMSLRSTLIMLSKKDIEKSGEVECLKRKIFELDDQHKRLSQKLSEINSKHKSMSKPMLGDFEIKYDGKLFLDGVQVQFENSRQAHRLIEHLIRQLLSNIATVSCIWGYPLFGWKAKKLSSMPNRLFNTAVAKINGPIAAKMRPMFLKSDGKNSWRWRCQWDAQLLLQNSDISRAEKLLSSAKNEFSKNNINGALSLAANALQSDPKSFNAICFFASQPKDVITQYKDLIFKSSEIIRMDVTDLEKGITEAKCFLNSDDDLSDYKEPIMREIIAMSYLAAHVKKCLEELSNDKIIRPQPLYLSNVMMRLASVQTDIAQLKASGAADKGIWANIVHSENFLGLISIPQIQSIVNRFYNPVDKMFEDPRLVQLALVLMLSDPRNTGPLEETRTDEDFFEKFKKTLYKQLMNLEDQIAVLPQ